MVLHHILTEKWIIWINGFIASLEMGNGIKGQLNFTYHLVYKECQLNYLLLQPMDD